MIFTKPTNIFSWFYFFTKFIFQIFAVKNKAKMLKLKNEYILLLILLIAIILRFYNYASIPFSHDEFSAFFRLQYSSYSELIQYGVVPDGHPAGIQVFLYYWTKLFGFSEIAIKLPFTIMGVFAVYLSYLIAKKWFNTTTALIVSAYIASLQYTVMYSQIARPYMSGLFFTLLMVYSLTQLIKNSQRKQNLYYILFVLAASLCSYNHYFSALFAAIVYFSGFIFLSKKQYPKYLFSAIIIGILFIPHIQITLKHLSYGGIGGWLAKPEPDFIINYIKYLFQYSYIGAFVLILIIGFGIYQASIKNLLQKKYILFSIWFVLPLLIGYLYSVFVDSVLQFSVLIFSFPYFLFLLFGHFKQQKPVINLIIVFVILSSNIYGLIYERKHYQLNYESVYHEMLIDYNVIKQSDKKCIGLLQSHKKATKYYADKYNLDISYIWLDSFKNELELIDFLKQKSKKNDYLFLAIISPTPPVTASIVREYFPYQIYTNNYVIGKTYLFSTLQTEQLENNNIIFQNNINFDNKSLFLNQKIDTLNITDSVFRSAPNSYLIDSLKEFSPNQIFILQDIRINPNDIIDVTVNVKPINNDKNWIKAYHSIRLSDIKLNSNSILLKTYIWNKSKSDFYIDDFEIIVRKGNPYIYGLQKKIFKYDK